MKRLVAAAGLGLLLGACGEDPLPPPPPPAPPPAPARRAVARLSELRGSTAVTRDGRRAPATPGDAFEGDVVETGADGHALLAAGGREVELLENSRFRVGASLADLALDLGELVFLEGDGGEVQTAAGLARLGAGSRVRLSAGDGGTSVEVGLGSLELLDVGDGGVEALKAGQRFVVGVGVLDLEDVAAPPPAVLAEVKLTPTRGKVTLRPKSGASRVLPPEGSALQERSSFAVATAGLLRAEAAGVTLDFEGGALGSLEPDPVALRAALGRGAAKVVLQGGQQLLLEGKKPVTLRATTTTTAALTATPAGPRVEVLGGGLEVALPDGARQPVSAEQVATLGSRGVQVARRAPPVVSLPGGRALRVAWARPGPVALAFDPGEGPLEVAADADFTQVLVTAGQGDVLTVPAPLKGVLYWRRRGDAAPGSVRFDRDEHAGAVAAKSDTVAETGLKATVYFQGAVPSLTFTFPAQERAQGWRFRVYRAGALQTPVVDKRLTENRAVVESGALGEGSYVWSAVPLDRTGAEVSGGRMNKMDIVFDNSLTQLVLTAPKEGERAATATGVAPLGARLSLNGKPVPLDAAGRFAVPTGGAAVLVFKLTARDGAERYWVRRQGR